MELLEVTSRRSVEGVEMVGREDNDMTGWQHGMCEDLVRRAAVLFVAHTKTLSVYAVFLVVLL